MIWTSFKVLIGVMSMVVTLAALVGVAEHLVRDSGFFVFVALMIGHLCLAAYDYRMMFAIDFAFACIAFMCSIAAFIASCIADEMETREALLKKSKEEVLSKIN